MNSHGTAQGVDDRASHYPGTLQPASCCQKESMLIYVRKLAIKRRYFRIKEVQVKEGEVWAARHLQLHHSFIINLNNQRIQPGWDLSAEVVMQTFKETFPNVFLLTIQLRSWWLFVQYTCWASYYVWQGAYFFGFVDLFVDLFVFCLSSYHKTWWTCAAWNPHITFWRGSARSGRYTCYFSLLEMALVDVCALGVPFWLFWWGHNTYLLFPSNCGPQL